MEVNEIRGPALAAAATHTQPKENRPEARPAVAPPAAVPLEGPRKNPVASVFVQQEFPPNTRLRFDEESNRIVAQVLDDNNEVIRQLPPQELLDISARFNRLEGLLYDREG